MSLISLLTLYKQNNNVNMSHVHTRAERHAVYLNGHNSDSDRVIIMLLYYCIVSVLMIYVLQEDLFNLKLYINACELVLWHFHSYQQ